jgi:Big-like domain-containing protein
MPPPRASAGGGLLARLESWSFMRPPSLKHSAGAAVCLILLYACGGGGNVTVPDTVKPTVSLTGPAAGSTVNGTVTLVAVASDDREMAGVRFQVDGVDLAPEDTEAPYQQSWNTRPAANGAHSVTAVARDAAGNTQTAAPVAITVNNVLP